MTSHFLTEQTSEHAWTEKVKTCIYLPSVSSDNSRLHQGVLQVE